MVFIYSLIQKYFKQVCYSKLIYSETHVCMHAHIYKCVCVYVWERKEILETFQNI